MCVSIVQTPAVLSASIGRGNPRRLKTSYVYWPSTLSPLFLMVVISLGPLLTSYRQTWLVAAIIGSVCLLGNLVMIKKETASSAKLSLLVLGLAPQSTVALAAFHLNLPILCAGNAISITLGVALGLHAVKHGASVLDKYSVGTCLAASCSSLLYSIA
jgi:hypothetical protein